tara:strand:- start:716 stop:2044 length:1329 start_codon:yes stop_codon:yes gene_type:complete
MEWRTKTGSLAFLLGDVVFWAISLWVTLLIRYGDIPSYATFKLHIEPFAIIFIIWIFVFFIADLYRTQTLFVQTKLPKLIFRAQIINSVIATIFFYLIPYFGITPKTILFIDLIISILLISFWRIYLSSVFFSGEAQKVLLVGNGEAVDEIYNEIHHNERYKMSITRVDTYDVDKITRIVNEQNISTLIINIHDKELESIHPSLYKLLFSSVRFINLPDLYEEVFERIPISLISDSWLLENISNKPKHGYDIARRAIDIVIAFVGGIISLIFYPFVMVAIYLEDRGSIFIRQRRVGKDDSHISLLKFRTMTHDDAGVYGEHNNNRVTKVGRFLRVSRIDELPQLWNVVVGDVSLIGPRPELPDLVRQYNEYVPYYNTRHLIQPGLSGWAQIYHERHPHHAADIAETKNKLSYDLFYTKNRSLLLDVTIILKTIKTLLSRAGV